MPFSVLLYGQETARLAPEVPTPWVANQHWWTGWDGSEWDLSHGTSGLALQAGVRGMHMPPIIRYSQKGPAVAGSFWRGSIADEREVFWPIRVFEPSNSEAWVDHNRRFWETFNPDQTGTWTVQQPTGESRSIDLRFTSESDDADDIDSLLTGWALYGINLVAEQPFWRGESITRTFHAAGSGGDYYGGGAPGGFGPPFVTQPGSTTSNASITNPGQVAAWPVWTIQGPFTAASVGFAGKQVSVDLSMTEGQSLTIDTAPTAQTVIDHNGNDRTTVLAAAADFAEIPPGQSLPLDVSMVGTGLIKVEVVPLYYRAH